MRLMERVLILGGTGFVGRSLVNRLIGAQPGLQVVVPSRRPARATAIRSLPGVDLQEADVHDPATLTRLVSGCDAVVNLVAILQGDDAAFERAHVQLPRLLSSATAAAGVKRLVHVSALGVPDGSSIAPSRYLRSKAAGEAVLRAASGLQASLVRPSVIFGEGDRSTNLFADLQRMLPLMALGGGEARLQPVWVEDVAEALLRLLQVPAAALPPVLECAGPEVFTLSELVRCCGRLAGSNVRRSRCLAGLRTCRRWPSRPCPESR